MLSEIKECITCHEEQPYSSFQKCSTSKGGFRHKCRKCMNEYARDWNNKNREKVKAIQIKSRRRRKVSDPVATTLKDMLNTAKRRSVKSGVPFALKLSDLIAPPSCPVFGMALDYGVKERSGPGDNSPSIDRIVPAQGYVTGNVRIISFRANRIRNDATLDDLHMLVHYLEGQAAVP